MEVASAIIMAIFSLLMGVFIGFIIGLVKGESDRDANAPSGDNEVKE